MARLKLNLQTFVDCIGLEINETVYGQIRRLDAAGLLVTISKKPTLHPYSKILLEILTQNLNSKIQLEILTRKLVWFAFFIEFYLTIGR